MEENTKELLENLDEYFEDDPNYMGYFDLSGKLHKKKKLLDEIIEEQKYCNLCINVNPPKCFKIEYEIFKKCKKKHLPKDCPFVEYCNNNIDLGFEYID